MSIELRLLRYFVATSEAGSANRAAEQLHLTQPTLSRQLRQLERLLGVALFERAGPRLVISRAGELLLPMARDLIARSDQFSHAAADLAAGRMRQLRLAVPMTTLTDVVAPFIATLQPEDPIVTVRELDPLGAAAALSSGADLAIVGQHPGPEWESLLLGVLPVWAYVTADDAWADREQVDLSELGTRTLVVLDEAARPRAALDAALHAAGIGLGEVVECDNARVAQALASAGRGVAVVSDDPRFNLVPVAITCDGGLLSLRLYAAWDRSHYASATLRSVVDRLAHFIEVRYPNAAHRDEVGAHQGSGSARSRQ